MYFSVLPCILKAVLCCGSNSSPFRCSASPQTVVLKFCSFLKLIFFAVLVFEKVKPQELLLDDKFLLFEFLMAMPHLSIMSFLTFY